MRMQVQVDQAVHKAVRDLTMRNQGLQEEGRLMFSEAVGIASVDYAREEPASEAGVGLEDVRGLN